MGYVTVAKVAEVPAGGMKKVEAGAVALLLANVGGKFYALDDRCPHMGGSLSEGTIEGTAIKCPRHGAMFDLATGKAIGQARILFLKMSVMDANSHRVEVRGDAVFVEV